jgi:hypothetical protein
LLLAAISLSIGWGIRGNFGHEFGAMMPGALAAIAVCLFSGREDWRRRVPYFAFFGALGWGFGGSIAYMPTIAYTHSGHLATQIYGFFAVFVVGFLWAGMGGAGTAYPAVVDRNRLTEIFRPLCWVFAIWALQYALEDYLVSGYEHLVRTTGADVSDFRQRSPFYWLDSEWLEATTALLALCLFDLWDRRFRKFPMLLLFGVGGALIGLAVQRFLTAAGWMGSLLSVLVHYQGDLTAVDPATNLPFDPRELIVNWPQVFFDLGHHLGWIFGLILGAGVYFYRYGRWRSGASLLMHITLGSYIVFLVGPVLLSNFMGHVGGFRLTPPRGDSWANIVGAYLGMLVYVYRNGLAPIGLASIVSGVIGGTGFMIAQFIKLLLLMPGNPVITQDPGMIQRWAHWRSANWHSICTEQGVGLFYGLGIAIALGLLATRVRPVDNDPPVRRWTEAFSVSFILNVLLFVNMVKMIEDWTRERAGGFRSVPLIMKAPLFPNIALSASAWFTLVFLLMTLCTVALLAVHLRRPLALVPSTWVGKGQWFYLVFLWAIVIGNFTRALVAFSEQRIATEGVIIINALIATFLILFCARDSEEIPVQPGEDYARLARRTIIGGLAALLIGAFGFTAVVHGVYRDKPDGWGGRNIRFGPEADWRIHPILKNAKHR